MNYLTNIIYDTTENQNFRVVLHTGEKSQLVIMSIPSGEEIGMETHERVEQTLFFLSGTGIAILDGKEQPVHAGDALVVEPGTEHNVLNTGKTPLKIYTVYAPPNHLDGRVHATKADADKDEEDEAFGHGSPLTSAVLLSGSNGHSKVGVLPGVFPDIEPRPEPASPLENPDEPGFNIHDNAETYREWRMSLARESEVEL